MPWRGTARDRNIILVDEEDIAVALTGIIRLRAGRGRAGVRSIRSRRSSFKRSFGLKYPLDGLKLALGERTGTSNEATSGLFRIEAEPDARARRGSSSCRR